MNTLQRIQQKFQSYLLNNAKKKPLTRYLSLPHQGELDQRLMVYANAYRYRLLEVLEKDYPLLSQWLGEEFIEIAFAYIEMYPSQHVIIIEFGQRFPEFLAQTQPYAAYPYLAELAQLLRALNRAVLQTPTAVCMTRADLTAVPISDWADLRFALHPSVQFLSFTWNTLAIHQALTQKKAMPKVCSDAQKCIVWCKQLQGYYLVVTEREYFVMQACQHALCFSELCNRVTERYFVSDPDAATLWIAQFLSRVVDEQLFVTTTEVTTW